MKSAPTRLSLALLAALALAHSGTGGAPRASQAATTTQPAAVALADSDVLGAGRWIARAVCIGCIGTALATGGASIMGLALLVATHPGLAGFCLGACLT